MQVFAPEQAVVPVIVAVILIIFPRGIRFRRIVTIRCAVLGSFRREDGGSLVDVKSNVALEMNGIAGIRSSGKVDRATASFGCGFDRFVDGGSIQCLAVASPAKRLHVEKGVSS